MGKSLWRDFFLSSEFDFFIFLLLIFLIILSIVLIALFCYNNNKKREIKKYLKIIRFYLETISSTNRGGKMNFDFDDIMSEHTSVNNPKQTQATSKDIAKALQGLTSIGAELAGNLARVAVNTSLNRQMDDLTDLNQKVQEFAQDLSNQTSSKGENHIANAIGGKVDKSLSQEEKRKEGEKQKEKVGTENQQNDIFALKEAREVIRKINPLKHCIEAHGVDINSDFSLNEYEDMVSKMISKLEARSGNIKPEDGEEMLLKFLKSVQAAMWSQRHKKRPYLYGLFSYI